MKNIEFHEAFRSQAIAPSNLYDPIVADEHLEWVLDDFQKRVSKEFQIPAAIKTNVRFWLKVYTKYSSQHIVLFDSNDLNVIYGVIDLRELANTARNQVVYEIVSKNRIDTTVSAFKKAFALLERNHNPKNPSTEQKAILAAIKRSGQRKSFRELAYGFKYIRGQRDHLLKGLLASESFFPKMELIFAGFNVPPELTRLSLVESSFNLKATSKVGASGVWQFMPSMGKKYLTINDQIDVDERRSPLKSTIAAAKLLLWNYKYLGNWPLAIISYNHGLKNLPRLKGERALNFSAISHLFRSGGKKAPLGWASRSYYTSFLAVVYAEAYKELFFGKIPAERIRPIRFEHLARRQTGLSIAIEKSVPLHEFRFLNADIQNIHQMLPKGFMIVIPSQRDNIRELVTISTKNTKHPSSHREVRRG